MAKMNIITAFFFFFFFLNLRIPVLLLWKSVNMRQFLYLEATIEKKIFLKFLKKLVIVQEFGEKFKPEVATFTAWKVSKYGVISVRIQENTDQK